MRISDWSSDVCSSDLVDSEFQQNLQTLLGMPRNYRRRGGALNGQQVRMSPVDFQELHAELQQLLPQTTFAHCAQRSQGGHYLCRDFVLQVGQVFELAGKRSEERRVGNECVVTVRDRV